MRAFLVPLPLAACLGAPPEPPPVAIDIEDPAACIACHEPIVREWRESQHSRAHHDNDPVYAGMRVLRMKNEGDAIADTCAGCHTPRDPSQANPTVAAHGVSCATCHNLDGVDLTKRGAAALTRAAPGTLRGPHTTRRTSLVPHDAGEAAPWLTDGQTVCLACHGSLDNAAGAVTCNTGPEHAQGSGGQTCTDCHMPVVSTPSGSLSTYATHRSHAFLGPHTGWPESPEFLSAGLDATFVLDGAEARLTLSNTSSHSFPTGFPGRMVLVRAEAFDAAGASVWTSHQGDPMTQDPQSVLNKVYVDADGKPTLPPYGTKIARDTRLGPAQTRTLTWAVPATAARAEVVLAYRMVPPPAVAALGLTDHPDGTTRPFKSLAASAAPRP